MSDPVTRASGVIDGAPYATRLTAGRHELTADEPVSAGGADAGPPPFALLLSGLIACTAITLRMYADRKGWTVKRVAVDAVYHHVQTGAFIERVLHIDGDLNDEQRARMADIAERTPVTLALKAASDIRTRLGAAASS
jgi:putative redox protein